MSHVFYAGFSILFALMDPVPYQIKVVFHIYGGFSFIYSIIEAVYAFQAKGCVRLFSLIFI